MRKKSDFYFKIALVILDILALLSAFTIAYILRISLDPRPFIPASMPWILSPPFL